MSRPDRVTLRRLSASCDRAVTAGSGGSGRLRHELRDPLVRSPDHLRDGPLAQPLRAQPPLIARGRSPDGPARSPPPHARCRLACGAALRPLARSRARPARSAGRCRTNPVPGRRVPLPGLGLLRPDPRNEVPRCIRRRGSRPRGPSDSGAGHLHDMGGLPHSCSPRRSTGVNSRRNLPRRSPCAARPAPRVRNASSGRSLSAGRSAPAGPAGPGAATPGTPSGRGGAR